MPSAPPCAAVSVSAMSSGSWKVLKVGAPGHGSYSLTKVKYIILKVVICIFGLTKVNYIIFKRKNMNIFVGNDVLNGGKEI